MLIHGQIYIINGNEPILLNDPSRVWVVQSGSMALFAVTLKHDVIEGTRRYLCSINQGEALFGTANQQHQILAVPIGETELLQVHQECFRELVANADAIALAWIETWLLQLGGLFSQVTMPKIQVKAKKQVRFSLNNNQTFQPEAGVTCWVQLHQGTVRFLGFEEVTLTTTTATFPLTNKMWLEAVEGVQLTTNTTSEFQNPDTLLAGLSQLHSQLLQCINIIDEQEAQAELIRLHDRQRLNRQVTAEAIGELVSTLNSQDGDFFLEGTPLLVAAGAVGRAMGIKIRPPSRSENLKRLKEPLEAIVRASRIRMRRVLLRDNWWEKDSGPIIAYTQDNRPVALLPMSATRYEIFDPVERTRIRVDEQIAATLAPVAYMFYRSLPDKALQAIDIFKFTLQGHSQSLLAIVFSGIAVTLLGMITPYATSIIIDNAIPDSDRGLLLQIGLGLLVAALGTALFQLAQGFALLRMESAGDASTQAGVWDRLLNLPVSFFREYTTGDLLSRITSVSTIRRQLSGRTLINLITSLFALFYLGQLFYYNYKLALIAVATAVVAIAFTTLSGVLLLTKVRPLLEIRGSIFGQTVQLINGISKLHIAGAQERAFAAWSKNYTRQIKLELSTQQIEDAVVLFNTVMPILTSGVLFWFTIRLLENPPTSGAIELSLGTFLAFNAAFSNFTKGTTDLSNTVTEILQVIPQWQRTQPILSAIPEVDLCKADPGRLIGNITLEHITFRYRSDGPLTLDDVSISAAPGEFIALIGGSGSGKSTILRLLLGFETPIAGSIYYDGQDLSGLDVYAVRRQLGVVLQNGQLSSASIFENIAGGAQITLDEAWEAARMSGFAEDITTMPMQMHTVVSEGGGNLSGGQRQRLLIARALALKPRILLFDEATSALDNRTQAIVSESLDNLQVTRIAIAHRLSTIRNAHRIYVLQGGRVVQQGTFQELAAVEGLFAQLMARQMA
ncbi:NHLP bacteriocin export ABC transporter permease/ATPase subunit [Nostoc sp. UCD121]|uniref:NHLP bacteriocin export ABC transporter permease/ATPase subunit n=1 Tax=unclassified Nostoc TaxID=2593658 RepID=UPI001627B915|nr:MULTISPECIES: NHLP bacteriocin export ABC transporter permease/ATPase subunit [unclassified Nostoc]MBC1223607.1 NHLP bacteriocin export ABC transporter permease/ATPase subunit [Nostoc sp. UCD120]MBC1280086.1 NHLP bacteriocin export ABC transporter permease/ATPase subunit [Nostoc sp. UCD121]MBC1297075.1 NHLP bacteriocin export ABC transporter permease/ATPase subunit [Nostoc sp. UCD122]